MTRSTRASAPAMRPKLSQRPAKPSGVKPKAGRKLYGLPRPGIRKGYGNIWAKRVLNQPPRQSSPTSVPTLPAAICGSERGGDKAGRRAHRARPQQCCAGRYCGRPKHTGHVPRNSLHVSHEAQDIAALAHSNPAAASNARAGRGVVQQVAGRLQQVAAAEAGLQQVVANHQQQTSTSCVARRTARNRRSEAS